MTHYAEEMNRLQRTLLAMAAHAEGAVTQAMSALLGANPELAHQVIRDDGILDQFEIEIDEIAIHLLTKAPLAADLRFVTAAMKISTNLERVGDEAVTMSRRIIDLATEPQLRTPSDLGRMADMALEMLRDAMGAFRPPPARGSPDSPPARRRGGRAQSANPPGALPGDRRTAGRHFPLPQSDGRLEEPGADRRPCDQRGRGSGLSLRGGGYPPFGPQGGADLS